MEKNQADVIIIGAGAAGLMAARELAREGTRVIILEARERAGGRLHTIQPEGFSGPVEAGAEFVHGRLPLTLQLLQEAGIEYEETDGAVWQKDKGRLCKQEGFLKNGELLDQPLQKLETDMTVQAFIDKYLQDEKYKDLRESLKRFVQGYDAADPKKASTFTLRDEWSAEDEPQYRVKGGYIRLVDHLVEACEKLGCRFIYNASVSIIKQDEDQVTILTHDNCSFLSTHAIVTLPLGVLQHEENRPRFIPDIPEYWEAARAIGFGSVIKILMEFQNQFWEDQAPKMGFLFSDAIIPTWWTQNPKRSGLLTGWLAGPPADQLKGMSDEKIETLALESLGHVFNLDIQHLKTNLKAWHIANWPSDIYARGGYAYSTPESKTAVKKLEEPVSGMIFFAGEGVYTGPYMGMAEAALTTGLQVSTKILKQLIKEKS